MGEAQVEGKISTVPFSATVQLAPLSPMIWLHLEFDFGEKTEVGAQSGLPNLPEFARDEEKLRLVVPLPFAQPRFYAHSAFHIRPVNRTRYPVLRYALAEGGGRGVAIFSDRATAGVFRQSPSSLELVLAYGGPFIYAPGLYAPLKGRQGFDLGLAFYGGDFALAQVPLLADEFSMPLLAWPLTRSGSARDQAGSAFSVGSYSLVDLQPSEAAVLTAAYPEGSDLVLRLWRPYPGEVQAKVTVTGARSLYSADLRGKALSPLARGATAQVTLRQNQVLTLRAAR